MASPARLLKALTFLLIITAVAYFGSIWLITPTLAILPFSVSVYRRLNDWSIATWLRLIPALFEFVFGMRIKISGHCRPLEGPCIIVLNHRTRFDWLYLWCYMLRLGDLTKHKIILKSSLKKIPIFGWAMQAAQFMFLSRKWSTDEKYMTDSLTYFATQGYPVQLLIFPEGTDLSEYNKAQSHKFSEQQGLQKYHHVLHPKTKGFVLCIKKLREGGTPVHVYNMTVGYIGAISQNESDLATGKWPTEIHFDCSYVPPSHVPIEELELEEWLKQCWQKKEEQLASFYANGHFDSPYLQEGRFSWAKLSMVATLLSWAGFHAILFYSLSLFSALRWYYFCATILLIVLTNFTSGLESAALRFYKH